MEDEISPTRMVNNNPKNGKVPRKTYRRLVPDEEMKEETLL